MSHGDSKRISHRIADAVRIAEQTEDEELRAHLARYLCVLASGFIEAECCRIVLTFARTRADPEVLRYVSRQLDYFQNPNVERILALVGHFNDDRRTKLETRTASEHKDAVNSLVGNKNNIAHGEDTGISLGRFKGYHANALLFLKEVEAVFSG